MRPKEMGQGAVVIAGGLKGHPARATAVGEKSRDLGEIFQSIGDAKVAATPVGVLQEHHMVSLGDVDGYPHRGERARTGFGHSRQYLLGNELGKTHSREVPVQP